MSADAAVGITVAEAPLAETLPLRAAVLRPDGRPAAMPGDDDPATLHLAARTPAGQVVGVVRLSPAPCPWPRPLRRVTHPLPPPARTLAEPCREPEGAEGSFEWQLRGMATDPAVRDAGVGRALVVAGLRRVTARGARLVWCEARTGAAGFYERMGFTAVTEPYDKPHLGPHVGMLLPLGPDAR